MTVKNNLSTQMNKAQTLSKLYASAKGKSLWRRSVILTTLNAIDKDPKTGAFLGQQLAEKLLDEQLIEMDFTKDRPAVITELGRKFMKKPF